MVVGKNMITGSKKINCDGELIVKNSIFKKLNKLIFNLIPPSIYYWFYYRISKYHIIKLDMNPSYKDVDYRMFLACFKLLGEFVEDELGTEKWFENTELYKGYRIHSAGGTDEKAIDLWLWYKDQRNSNFIDFYDLEEFDGQKLYNTKLLELMEIRETLWT